MKRFMRNMKILIQKPLFTRRHSARVHVALNESIFIDVELAGSRQPSKTSYNHSIAHLKAVRKYEYSHTSDTRNITNY